MYVEVIYIIIYYSLLPMKISWALMYHILKGPQIMMTFKGRKSNNTYNDNNSTTNYEDIRMH